jgi:hypothetical protein
MVNVTAPFPDVDPNGMAFLNQSDFHMGGDIEIIRQPFLDRPASLMTDWRWFFNYFSAISSGEHFISRKGDIIKGGTPRILECHKAYASKRHTSHLHGG